MRLNQLGYESEYPKFIDTRTKIKTPTSSEPQTKITFLLATKLLVGFIR